MPQKTAQNPVRFPHGLSNRRELMKSAVWLAGGCLVANVWKPLSIAAAAPDADVQAENIQYASGDFKIDAYFARPKAEGKNPGVLIVHDDHGLNDQIRGLAARFAAAGFTALAPDLLSRSGGISSRKNPDEVTDAIRQLSVDATLQDLKSGFSFLDKNTATSSGKTSIIGFGWGAWRSVSLATNVDGLYRTVYLYGVIPSEGLSDLESPLLAHYAEFDFRNTGNALWTQKQLKDLGKQFTYYVYPKVNYGFFDETSHDYNEEQAKLAWSRTLEFLKA
jgi:carboxymethylenebutenolidase